MGKVCVVAAEMENKRKVEERLAGNHILTARSAVALASL